MQASIEIDLEISDGYVLDDIVRHLETVLPYMADNVLVKSRVPEAPINDAQRRALFALFDDVFRLTDDESRYAFTRLALGKTPEATVSWSSHKPGALTAVEATVVLGALSILNV